jgi:aspartate-semialdehyde dehydrogenase
MPTTDRELQRLVIAGASSLLGHELKSLLEESRFAGWDLRLTDEDETAGLLTAAAGGVAVIQKVDEDTFRSARFAFLAGSAAFGAQCLAPAKQAGAVVIDLSHAVLNDPDATPWYPKIESLSGKSANKSGATFSIFSVGAIAVTSLAFLLQSRYGLRRMVAVLYEPVSEAGRAGIEELETQTSQLLSFQSIGSPVFGTQSAFNMLPRYGSESKKDLGGKLRELRAEISAAVGDPDEDAKISVNLVHAPVFYGTTFSICADLDRDIDSVALAAACRDAGFLIAPDNEDGPSNVSVAGETSLYLRAPQPELTREKSWWFWGAGDNLRVPAWNAIKLADWLDS